MCDENGSGYEMGEVVRKVPEYRLNGLYFLGEEVGHPIWLESILGAFWGVLEAF